MSIRIELVETKHMEKQVEFMGLRFTFATCWNVFASYLVRNHVSVTCKRCLKIMEKNDDT